MFMPPFEAAFFLGLRARSYKMSTHEIRVRAVSRFAVTHFTRDGAGASSRVVGEFDNSQLADEVGHALQNANPGASLTTSDGAHHPGHDLQFVLVSRTFDAAAHAFYADSVPGVEQMLRELETNDRGVEYRVFSRKVDVNPHKPAATESEVNTSLAAFYREGGESFEGKVPVRYPSRHAIGETVMRKAIDNGTTGHAAQVAIVAAVKFIPGKVLYDLQYPSGRAQEINVDSCDVEDI